MLVPAATDDNRQAELKRMQDNPLEWGVLIIGKDEEKVLELPQADIKTEPKKRGRPAKVNNHED